MKGRKDRSNRYTSVSIAVRSVEKWFAMMPVISMLNSPYYWPGWVEVQRKSDVRVISLSGHGFNGVPNAFQLNHVNTSNTHSCHSKLLTPIGKTISSAISSQNNRHRSWQFDPVVWAREGTISNLLLAILFLYPNR